MKYKEIIVNSYERSVTGQRFTRQKKLTAPSELKIITTYEDNNKINGIDAEKINWIKENEK